MMTIGMNQSRYENSAKLARHMAVMISPESSRVFLPKYLKKRMAVRAGIMLKIPKMTVATLAFISASRPVLSPTKIELE